MRHYDRLFGPCFRLTGNRASAQDLAQCICAALLARLAQWQDKTWFATWLWRVTAIVANDLRRRLGTACWGDCEPARQHDIATSTAKGWLTTAMAHLSPDLRDTVALVLAEDMTEAEAARVLGMPLRTA